ncbi:hypothetical protein RQM47_02315 [Rubrivirga sp. S365]|uniref:Lipocalin-like domain-containing protein n=1 Tax=Rubrivirga litoralis TaxID=3075598 RepID=A0ABU3BQH2_9BACT|nr:MULTISPECIES: hypothetical protein [unclassified Rubrivirga]MDT0631546.1 hypothetical protein [Rubrivirga sp. F394]MDT7855471.1 hypothetical protein [Rubrivirga sp. S365]
MPTPPRPARRGRLPLLAVLVGLAALTACDTTNPGGNLDLVEGTYSLAELSFDPTTTDLSTANVIDVLEPGSARLTIYSDGNALLSFRRLQGGLTRVDLRPRASRERVTLEAVRREDEDFLADILLPPSFALGYTGEPANTLEGSFSQSNVDLEAFDPERYQDQRSNSGQLSVRFERVTP